MDSDLYHDVQMFMLKLLYTYPTKLKTKFTSSIPEKTYKTHKKNQHTIDID